MQRLSHDVARSVVSAILEKFCVTPAQLLARVKKRDRPARHSAARSRSLRAPPPQGRAARHRSRRRRHASTISRELALAEILDDARSLSLFASERLIWVVNAEAALPRGRSPRTTKPNPAARPVGDAAPLAAYLKDPTPGVALVFEAIRFDFEGDDKRKQERVRKFYAAIPDVVELRRFAAHEARAEAESLVAPRRLAHGPRRARPAGGSAGRGHRAHRRGDREAGALSPATAPIGVDDIAALVPDARATTIFALVNALGRRDRARALEILDTLTREGEYLPLALAFLSTQFRMALVAREAGLKSSAADPGTLHPPGSADVGIARRAGLLRRWPNSASRNWSAP